MLLKHCFGSHAMLCYAVNRLVLCAVQYYDVRGKMNPVLHRVVSYRIDHC